MNPAEEERTMKQCRACEKRSPDQFQKCPACGWPLHKEERWPYALGLGCVLLPVLVAGCLFVTGLMGKAASSRLVPPPAAPERTAPFSP